MTQDDLRFLVNKICVYFGQEKTVTVNRLQSWIDKVKDIPADACDFIRNKIEDNHENIPRNLPKWIRAYYHEWRNISSQAIYYQETKCEECHNKGFLWCRRIANVEGRPLTDKSNNQIYETISYRCASCENWKKHVHWKSKPSATIEQIASKGYILIT